MFRQNFLKLPTLLLLEGRLSGGLKPVLEAKRKKKNTSRRMHFEGHRETGAGKQVRFTRFSTCRREARRGPETIPVS